MTRSDHPRRITYVLRAARRCALRGEGLATAAAAVRMPPRALRRFLVRHGGQGMKPTVETLVANDRHQSP